MTQQITLGLSPCPNDTFIFHALLYDLIKTKFSDPIHINPRFADVEKLNSWALQGKFEVTKLSLGVMPHILEDYILLSSGAALGWGCGPLIITSEPMNQEDLKYEEIAIPGKYTTANLLLDLHGGFIGKRKEMVFSDIIPEVANGKLKAGVIIHEGRFTYKNYNLHKFMDMGEWWENKFHLPLPLGAIAVRRDISQELARALQTAIAESISYAWANPQASKSFIQGHAQEMDENVTAAHIATFVTDYSKDMGDKGKDAINMLIKAALKNKKVENIFLE